MKKTRHEGDESTVSFWLWMKALYKEDECQEIIGYLITYLTEKKLRK